MGYVKLKVKLPPYIRVVEYHEGPRVLSWHRRHTSLLPKLLPFAVALVTMFYS